MNTLHPASAANVVHESETQRQHIRVQMPASARIGGKIYRIKNISAGGFCIGTGDAFALPAGMQEIKILFPFESFSFHLTVKVAALYHDQEKKTAGFFFHELSARQISLLNHVIKSCLSGFIIGEGDILNVVSRDNFSIAREEKPSNDNRTRHIFTRLFPLLMIAFAGLIGLFFLVGNIYENTSIIKSYMGIIEGNVFTIRAQGNGIYHSLLPEGTETVQKDQQLAIIKMEEFSAPQAGVSSIGRTKDIVIQSPCDCLLVEQFAQEGEFRALGEPIFRLMPQNGQTWVTATLPPDQIHRLDLMDDAHIKIAGEGSFIEGNVSEFIHPELDEETAKVKIKAKEPIPPEFFGRIAYVEFLVR